MLTSIHLKDFKSFADQAVEVAPLTLLVGANASGKSNFLDAIRFLQGLSLFSLTDALRGRIEGGRVVWPGIRGGIKEIARAGEPEFGVETEWTLDGDVVVHEITCRVAPEPAIRSESLTQKATGERFPLQPLQGRKHSLLTAVQPEFTPSMAHALERRDALLLALEQALFLDLMPSRMKDYVPRQMNNLGANGENLSAVVMRLCQDQGRKLDLVDWLSELCAPELADIDFVETELGDVMMVLVEKDGTRLSARSLSDGTLRFLGEIVAMLTAPPGSMLLMEEIENSLHPARAHLLVEMLESVTKPGRIQLIATTHSPLVLQALSKESLEHAIVFGRHVDAPGTVMRRLGDLPQFGEIVERRGIEHLFTTRWLERAL